MQPVRKVLSATHFKRVSQPDNNREKWTPCSPGDPQAEERAWTAVESDELLEPLLKLNDFVRAVGSVRPTVSEDDIRRHVEWTNDSGESHFSYNSKQWSDFGCRKFRRVIFLSHTRLSSQDSVVLLLFYVVILDILKWCHRDH